MYSKLYQVRHLQVIQSNRHITGETHSNTRGRSDRIKIQSVKVASNRPGPMLIQRIGVYRSSIGLT